MKWLWFDALINLLLHMHDCEGALRCTGVHGGRSDADVQALVDQLRQRSTLMQWQAGTTSTRSFLSGKSHKRDNTAGGDDDGGRTSPMSDSDVSAMPHIRTHKMQAGDGASLSPRKAAQTTPAGDAGGDDSRGDRDNAGEGSGTAGDASDRAESRWAKVRAEVQTVATIDQDRASSCATNDYVATSPAITVAEALATPAINAAVARVRREASAALQPLARLAFDEVCRLFWYGIDATDGAAAQGSEALDTAQHTHDMAWADVSASKGDHTMSTTEEHTLHKLALMLADVDAAAFKGLKSSSSLAADGDAAATEFLVFYLNVLTRLAYNWNSAHLQEAQARCVQGVLS